MKDLNENEKKVLEQSDWKNYSIYLTKEEVSMLLEHKNVFRSNEENKVNVNIRFL